MGEINPGDAVLVRDALGADLPRRAVSGVVQGRDFAVVWVCLEEEWAAARGDEHAVHALPWPAEDVRVADGVGVTAASS